jgi:hypothetical protein
MNVLVCGGRDYQDWEFLCSCLDKLHKKHGVELIIEGGANGADSHAATWADKNLIPRMTFHANWANLGNRAGPVRNENMIKFGKPDCVVAFKGGKGTSGMIKLARNAGLKIWEPCD